MLCKNCGCEMRIVFSGTRVQGDTSPDTQTRVFTVQTLRCLNRNCPKQDEVTVEHEQPLMPIPEPEPAGPEETDNITDDIAAPADGI